MLLNNYLKDINALLDSIASIVINHSLTIDKRPQEQAHIFGTLIFMDKSELHFKEFVDGSEGFIDKVAYSYHFQDQFNQLVFRYDNAKHKPLLAFVEHKHCADGILNAPAPNLQQVIQEAIVMRQLI